jgi:hypothetical protein
LTKGKTILIHHYTVNIFGWTPTKNQLDHHSRSPGPTENSRSGTVHPKILIPEKIMQAWWINFFQRFPALGLDSMTQVGNFGDASSMSTKVPIGFPKNNVHYEFRDFELHNIQLICPTKILGVGILIRFGRSPSISVGQSGTSSKSVGY